MENADEHKKKKKSKKKKKDKKKKEKKEKHESDTDKEEEEKEKEEIERQKDDIIAENFIVLLEMGRGAFGQIHLTYNKRDDVAVATKKVYSKNKNRNSSKTLGCHLNYEWNSMS